MHTPILDRHESDTENTDRSIQQARHGLASLAGLGVEEAIAAIATAIAQGRFNDDAATAQALTDAKGVALCKEAGSKTAVRPISIEDILGRLAGALLVTRHRDELLALCNGKQYCGKKRGLDELVNLLGVAMARNPEHATLSVDVSNAFNTQDAQLMVNQGARVPGIAPYTQLYFGQRQRRVTYGVSDGPKLDVLAEEGGAQGNALTPLIYAAGQEEAVACAMAPHDTEVLRACYADNSYLLGELAKTLNAYDALKPALASLASDAASAGGAGGVFTYSGVAYATDVETQLSAHLLVYNASETGHKE